MKFHKETTNCAVCGKVLRFPASGLNQAKIAKVMGSVIVCRKCTPVEVRALHVPKPGSWFRKGDRP